jgi:hypothetical protein
MRTTIYLILGILFAAAGIATWADFLLPQLPEAGYLRFMVGLVFFLMGAHRCLLGLFPASLDPHSRREESEEKRRLP